MNISARCLSPPKTRARNEKVIAFCYLLFIQQIMKRFYLLIYLNYEPVTNPRHKNSNERVSLTSWLIGQHKASQREGKTSSLLSVI